MERINLEATIDQPTADFEQTIELRSISELELALVGGGIADVVF